jgi:hypothetical protein
MDNPSLKINLDLINWLSFDRSRCGLSDQVICSLDVGQVEKDAQLRKDGGLRSPTGGV